MALVSFNEEERLLGRGRGLTLAKGRAGQSVEIAEVMGPAYSTIAHQIVPPEGFISKWARAFLKPEWLKKRPMIYPQRYSAPAFRKIWNVPLLATPEKPRDSWMFPQLVEVAQPLLARARETRRKVLDTFPKLKYILEGE